MYEVVLSRKAAKFFEDASASLQRRLDRCFDVMKANPRGARGMKALSGPLAGYYRHRVGDYRVIYHVDDSQRVVYVDRIAHRREAYS